MSLERSAGHSGFSLSQRVMQPSQYEWPSRQHVGLTRTPSQMLQRKFSFTGSTYSSGSILVMMMMNLATGAWALVSKYQDLKLRNLTEMM